MCLDFAVNEKYIQGLCYTQLLQKKNNCLVYLFLFILFY